MTNLQIYGLALQKTWWLLAIIILAIVGTGIVETKWEKGKLAEHYDYYTKQGGNTVKLKERYEKLYNNMKSGKYDIAVADENTFEMKVNISFIELLKDCEKEGVSIKNF